MITLKTKDDTAKMREAGLIVAEMLASCRAAVKPGVTTGELDRIAADILKRHKATSNFKGYGVPVLPPFPGVICTSVNEQIVHGIPGKRKLKEGEIISIDAGAIIDGWHADAAITVPVGAVSPDAEKLIRVTDEALRRAIAAAQVGKRLGDIGATVQKWVESQGFTVNQAIDQNMQMQMMRGMNPGANAKAKVQVAEQLKLVLKDLDKIENEKLMDTLLKVLDTA